MVTVELMFEEDQLIELLCQEFNKRYSFDDITKELMEQYFGLVVTDGSSSLFYGPNTLEDYVQKTWDAMSVINSHDNEYQEVKQAWENGEYEINGGQVVAAYKDNYLVEWYN